MIENLSEKLKKYAELIVKVGVNVQKGQPVVLYISVTQQELAHLIVEEAYGAGASEVMIEWKDTFSEREFLKHASEERLENVPEYIVKKGNYIAGKKAARISVMSADPGAYSGIDQKRIAKNQAAMGKALRQVRKATQNNDLSWTVVSAADQTWAEKVFPEKKGQAAIDALWEEIFKTTRIDKADPVKAWHEHDQKLHEKSDWLNEQQFSALHYVSPVTDITIGLPENHVWEGAGSFTPEGTEFMANMPTEEVFTAPDCRRIDGYVTSTKPLSYAGNILEDMKFTFKDGKVVEATAKKGRKFWNTFWKPMPEQNRSVKFLSSLILHRFRNQASSSSTRCLTKMLLITLLLELLIRSTLPEEPRCPMKNCLITE